MQTQLGTLPGGSGTLIKFIPNKNMIALSSGNAIRFFDATSYQPIWTQYANSGNILEMEVSPDGTMLIANYSDGSIFTLDLINLPPPTSTPGPGPTSTPRPTSTPGPTPTPVPSSSTGSRKTYTASGSYTTPGTFLCDQNQSICTNGADPDADKAHQYAADTFMFYNVHHGRNSFDNQGSTIISTVHFGVGYQNAFWDGYQMVYGDNMAADDVVGHEITHGVTQYASNLIYSYQSGAINESFSDVWGEFIDQTNGSGNDSLSVKWLMGEDTPLGAIRSMSDPTIFGNPDKMSSPYYYTGSGDNGGVHINSGVNNKAAYLMVDGSTFNGRTIIGIGLNKTAAVYYEAQVYHLTMGANYNDLYYALIQACQNLIGGVDGITQNDCDQVRTAAEAVEMIPTLPATATPTATSTFIPTDTPTNTPTFTPTNTFTPTATPPYSYNPLYLSLTSSQTIGGVASADEDILRFDGTNWSLFFDGSDVGVGSPDLFAFSIVDADTILMSFSANITVNGISATPQDVLRFDATSLGSATIGTFSMYFDGSDVGFDTTAENIDSLSLLPDGRLLISTTGNPSVPGLTTGKDEDVLAFTQTSFGDVTSGTWAMYFDGSDVGLADSSNEDVDALDVTSNGNIYLSTLGDFAVNGLSGFDEDVFVCTPTSIGDVTACNYSPTLYFDGSTWGLSANDVDAFNFLATGPIPTTAPSNTPTITPTRTNTPLATNTPTRTPSPTPTFTRTATSTVSPSATNTPTVTATIGGPAILTFTTVADTRVSQASPTTNYGTATTILVDGDSGAAQTGYIRFATNGISGSIQSAKLRVYCTTNGTANGPAAYLADSNWIESGTGGMTWNTQPALLSGAFDNKGAIGMDSWVEYDVTALVTGNNTYTFALVADSSDGITFSSREGTTPSQLVVALGSATPTPTATVGSSVTNTPIVTATSTRTPTATAVASPTSTNMPTATPTANITPSPTLTPTATSTLTLNFAPIDDTYIASGSPTTNYGPATTLQVDNSPIKHFLIKFDVSGLNGQQVTSAKLRLYNLDASSKGGDFYAVSDNSWQEETLTWNNAPVALTTLLASLGSVSANNWYEVDLTSLITGDGTYSLRISSTSSDGADYSSKEGANPPQLVITVH